MMFGLIASTMVKHEAVSIQMPGADHGRIGIISNRLRFVSDSQPVGICLLNRRRVLLYQHLEFPGIFSCHVFGMAPFIVGAKTKA